MASIDFDVDDYLDDATTGAMVKELRRRKDHPKPQSLSALDEVLDLLDLGRWREARDVLATIVRRGIEPDAKERAAILRKYASAMKEARAN